VEGKKLEVRRPGTEKREREQQWKRSEKQERGNLIRVRASLYPSGLRESDLPSGIPFSLLHLQNAES
jgi:hypothetical protein